MATGTDKDKEYNEFASPKVDDLEAPREPGEIRGCSVWMLLLLAFPRMAIQMAWSAQWAALGPYLGTMLSPSAVQVTQFIGPITGIFVAPAVGVFSDRSTNQWGRRRPFLLYAAVASIICWICMGYTRDIGEALGDYGTGAPGEDTDRTWTAVFTVFFYAWMDITVNVVQTPANLLVADFAGERQTLGASIGTGWATLGSLMVSGYIYFFGAAHLTLHWFLGMLSITMAITVSVCCVFAKETPLDKDAKPTSSAFDQVLIAFGSIIKGLRTLPVQLAVYCFVFFSVMYGYTAYNGNKGQFFGLVVYDGEATGADNCDPCTQAQDDYNHGVKVAGGSTDTMFNLTGYAFSWTLPFLVRKFGVKWVVTIALVPQSLLIVMAYCKVVAIDVLIVVITSISTTAIGTVGVPLIIHVLGEDAEIGMYFGAINSANCFGQLLNFAIGSGLVETSMGYKLPVLLGGIMSAIGVIFSAIFFRIEMHSL